MRGFEIDESVDAISIISNDNIKSGDNEPNAIAVPVASLPVYVVAWNAVGIASLAAIAAATYLAVGKDVRII
ncbi:hypothetical protein SAMN02745221_00132 [Thermosyntropha lipolytica DSM 11003]|uniref:Uncharacterized protein n=1 Tax=Thermosyntropha lipolytica DSM 11003 TaxID=1123382 RepID=A0A1M5JIW3_9FIRM|nr:hypothetical protein [Thermosyntropha lipolytica]SHG40199.1 hypothetical protein SAMN02745221_00132 [Thermosyntropha lipolytica DSM 11003]